MGSILLILVCQLAGEWLSPRLLGHFPAPLLGMGLLFGLLWLFPTAAIALQSLSRQMAKYLAIFFVPMGVGIMQMWAELSHDLLFIGLTVVLGTLSVGVVTAWTFGRVQAWLRLP